jgi:hypothetical protein
MLNTSPTALAQIEMASTAPAVLDSAHIADINGAFGTQPLRKLTLSTKVWMGVLRGYLLIAVALIEYQVVGAAL